MLDTAEKLRTASGVAGLPLGPNVHPVATITEYTLAAMGWGFPPAADLTVTIGTGCLAESELYFVGVAESEGYLPGAFSSETYFPGSATSQEYCG